MNVLRGGVLFQFTASSSGSSASRPWSGNPIRTIAQRAPGRAIVPEDKPAVDPDVLLTHGDPHDFALHRDRGVAGQQPRRAPEGDAAIVGPDGSGQEQERESSD